MDAIARIRLGIRVVLAVQLLTSFAAVALLGRMAPAVDRIAGGHLGALAVAIEALDAVAAGDGARLREVGRRAAGVEGGAALARAATAGDAPSAAEAARGLARASVDGLAASDAEARRLGEAGAWAMVLLGLVGFGASLAASRSVDRSVVRPLSTLVATVKAVRAGDLRRRCGPVEGPRDVAVLAAGIDELLDELARRPARRGLPPVAAAALDALVRGRAEPAVAVGRDGAILAANDAAREHLLGPEGAEWRARLDAPDGERVRVVARLGDTGVEIRAMAGPSA